MQAVLSPIQLPYEEDGKAATTAFAYAAEAMARAVVANCAPKLVVPHFTAAERKLGEYLHVKQMSPSVRSRVAFVDRKERIWRAVRDYFRPLRQHMDSVAPGSMAVTITLLAWDVYMLALATRTPAVVYLDVAKQVREIDFILHFRRRLRLSGEDQARLAVIRGTFAALRPSCLLPGLHVTAGAETAFRDRIDEILEDAYLAEAASLRRFLSFNANRASVMRDLRRLLRAISRERAWAKGVVGLASQAQFVPEIAASALDGLLEFAARSSGTLGPVALEPRTAPWRELRGPSAWWLELRRPVSSLTDHPIVRYYTSFGEDSETEPG